MGKLAGRGLAPRLARAKSRFSDAPPVCLPDAGRRSKDWLNTARWQTLRRDVLARDGYICRQTGVPLTGIYPDPDSAVVDHIKPHRGDAAMFWDVTNLQSVTKAWHDREKQRLERRGLA